MLFMTTNLVSLRTKVEIRHAGTVYLSELYAIFIILNNIQFNLLHCL